MKDPSASKARVLQQGAKNDGGEGISGTMTTGGLDGGSVSRARLVGCPVSLSAGTPDLGTAKGTL